MGWLLAAGPGCGRARDTPWCWTTAPWFRHAMWREMWCGASVAQPNTCLQIDSLDRHTTGMDQVAMNGMSAKSGATESREGCSLGFT